MSLTSVLQSLKGVAASSGCFLWGLVSVGELAETAIVPVTVIFPVTKIYASE